MPTSAHMKDAHRECGGLRLLVAFGRQDGGKAFAGGHELPHREEQEALGSGGGLHVGDEVLCVSKRLHEQPGLDQEGRSWGKCWARFLVTGINRCPMYVFPARHGI